MEAEEKAFQLDQISRFALVEGHAQASRRGYLAEQAGECDVSG
jgi:hypothetical protein